MPHGRVLRHAALLALFILLLFIGTICENPFDDEESSHAGEIREQLHETHGLGTFLFSSRSRWRAAPLTFDQETFPDLTDASIAAFVNRTAPPEVHDVRDNRTLISDDFFEELQLWRQPGTHAAAVAKHIDAQLEREREEVRAEAVRIQRRKSLSTRSSTPWWPGSLLEKLRSAPKEGVQSEEDEVMLPYPQGTVLHHREAPGLVVDDTGKYSRAAPSLMFSLTSNDVQRVPYPWVPTVSVANVGGSVRGIPKGRRYFDVPHRRTPHRPNHGWSYFYIALNFWKNEDVLPDFTEALVVFLEEEVKPFFNLSTSVVVSIYANVSPDKTADVIDNILIPRLHAIGVRVVFATTEGTCLGYLVRQPFHERIEWMACIRNKALEPLYKNGMHLFDQEGDAAAQNTLREDGLVVLFFNDIFFRPQDITTLLESRADPVMEADMRPHGWRYSTALVEPDSISPMAAGSYAHTTFDMACGMDFYFTFYDTWVTRDRVGRSFAAQMPYTDDHPSQEAFYRVLKGQGIKKNGGTSAATIAPEAMSIPVKCCWNGVAAIRGRFFLSPAPRHRLGFPADTQRTDLLGLVHEGMPKGDASTEQRSSLLADPVEAVRHSSAVMQRPSGALYDRLGGIAIFLNRTRVAHYYTRVLARRLHSWCLEWTSTRRKIASRTGVPFYEPATCENSSSFAKLLRDVTVYEQQHATDAIAQWTHLVAAPPSQSPYNKGERPPVEKGVVNASPPIHWSAAAPPSVPLSEDSVFYVARHPALRFRHAFTPSYGATVAGLKPVQDDVCLSSECLLICQDVMHAAILQERRAPIILLNPHVRVAYDHEHFNRIIRQTWFFENPSLYWAWTLARRVQVWWAQRWGSFEAHEEAPPSPSARADQIEDNGDDQLRECGKATSATDDWLHPSANAALPSVKQGSFKSRLQQLYVRDGGGTVVYTGIVDIPSLTRMECARVKTGSISLALGAFSPLVRLAQLLLVALLLRWLCWDIQASVAGSLATQSSTAPLTTSPSYAPEEQWWRAVYRTVWYTRLACVIRAWIDGVTNGRAHDERRTDDDDEDSVKNDFLKGGGKNHSRGRCKTSTVSPPLSLQPLRGQVQDGILHNVLQIAKKALRLSVHTLLWLLRVLCCLRFWCGCRLPSCPLEHQLKKLRCREEESSPRRSTSRSMMPRPISCLSAAESANSFRSGLPPVTVANHTDKAPLEGGRASASLQRVALSGRSLPGGVDECTVRMQTDSEEGYQQRLSGLLPSSPSLLATSKEFQVAPGCLSHDLPYGHAALMQQVRSRNANAEIRFPPSPNTLASGDAHESSTPAACSPPSRPIALSRQR